MVLVGLLIWDALNSRQSEILSEDLNYLLAPSSTTDIDLSATHPRPAASTIYCYHSYTPSTCTRPHYYHSTSTPPVASNIATSNIAFLDIRILKRFNGSGAYNAHAYHHLPHIIFRYGSKTQRTLDQTFQPRPVGASSPCACSSCRTQWLGFQNSIPTPVLSSTSFDIHSFPQCQPALHLTSGQPPMIQRIPAYRHHAPFRHRESPTWMAIYPPRCLL